MAIILLIVGIVVGYSISVIARMSGEIDKEEMNFSYDDKYTGIDKHIPHID